MPALNGLSDRLLRVSSAWTFVLAAVVYLGFILTVMPAQSAASRQYAGEWGAPDRHLVYTPGEFYAQVATWGDAGRRDYVAFRTGLDIARALAYTAFLVLGTGWAARAAFAPGDPRRLLNLAPLPAIACDYAENATGIFLVSAFPERHDAIVWIACATTAGKWITLALAHVVLAYVAGVAVARRLKAD